MKVNPRVSEAARQTFVCVVNAASGFRLYSRPVNLSPLLEVFLAGKGYEMPVLSRSAGKPLRVWGSLDSEHGQETFLYSTAFRPALGPPGGKEAGA
jgi:hypothetical protein